LPRAAALTRRALVSGAAALVAGVLFAARGGAEGGGGSPDGPTAATIVKARKGARGSKEAKGYQLCLSQCLYDCTTPKAGAAKTRGQCRVECKDECAVSREQL
jgi:hypothetical protein